ncbi:MAG TPA: hypothetical protein VKU41_05170 [Polyangiaceae bacterium]|nr:hypothetical protein [Polyangiaceae bacterium]
MGKKPMRQRTARRAAERAAAKLSDARERLASLEPGGSGSRPLPVESASQIEPHALASACLRCGGANRLVEHVAIPHDGETLRVARLQCPQCGALRECWFRIAPAWAN